MRTLMNSVVSIAFAIMCCACASSGNASSASAADKNTKTCALQVGQHSGPQFTVPADTTCTSKDGSLHLESHDRHLDIWLVPAAKSVDDAIAVVDQTIKPEFKDFRASSTTPLTIAGSPAKRLTGPGTEADDGDPGDADIIIFKAGSNMFIACTHGERLAAASRQWLLTVVETARTP